MLPSQIPTARLLLRPVTAIDGALVHRLFSDPDTFRHAPDARFTSPAQSEALLDRWLTHWAEHDLGTWVVTDRDSGEELGTCGLRAGAEAQQHLGRTDEPSWLNLGYRYAPTTFGRGVGTEAARAVLAHATEWCPGQLVTAIVRPHHPASIRVAQKAGLEPIGAQADVEGEAASVVLAAPRVQVAQPQEHRGEILRLWQRVNTAGGSVGFFDPAPEAELAAALDRHVRAVAAGEQVFMAMTAPRSRALLGFAVWHRGQRMVAHSATLLRVMVEPSQQGRNLGRILMAGCHAVGRDLGIELALLGVRGGSGTDRFYARCGWSEVGRVPAGLRFPDGDHDDITMARRLDGHDLHAVPSLS